MEISKKAIKRIQELKTRQRLPKKAGLRLGLMEDSVSLKWDFGGPGDSDFIVLGRDVPIWIDAQTFMHLADYRLDFERTNGHPRFLLRPR